MIGKTVSHYIIKSKIGAGGMGEVYLAEDTELHRNVALKFLPPAYSSDPDVLKRFKREAQAAAALNHPNIITVHEVAVHDGRPFIVMELIEGLPLGTHVRSKALSLPAILDLTIQIGDGLVKAHDANIVHRDLKPDNILIDGDGRPKILDFGLAKQAGVTKITREASTLGTVYYMSPEQTRGEDVDHRSDIFSLGTVLYEMITANLPFKGDHTSAIMYAIVNAEPQPLSRYNSEVTPELERIVSKMLAKDSGERYQSAADLVADLKRERRISDTAVHTARTPTPKRRGRSLWKIVLPLAVFGVALLVVFNPFGGGDSSDLVTTPSENSLAVMYFENMVDREDERRTGEIVANLLITALSDTDHLRVVSSQRLYDILKGLDKEGARIIDRNTSTQVATQAGASSMLLGSILQTEPTLVITYQLVDVASGDVKDSHRVDGRAGETVFALIDRMTVGLKQGLALPEASTKSDRPVAELTTSSADAYRIYLEGMDYLQKNFKREATLSFQRVLEIDSTMAMAAIKLATPNNFFLSELQRKAYVRQAHRHRDKVTARDRHMINALYASYFGSADETISELKMIIDKSPDDKEAHLVMAFAYWNRGGDHENGIKHAKRATEIDPRFRLAFNAQAYIYMDLGSYDDALAALDKYIQIAPEEPNPYDSQGEVYMLMGRLDDAIASYEKALELQHDFATASIQIANIHAYRGEYETALQGYARSDNHLSPIIRSIARIARAAVAAMRGQYNVALTELDKAIAGDEADDYAHETYVDKVWLKAFVYSEMGEYEKSLAMAEQALELERIHLGADRVSWNVKAGMLAMSGNYAAAEALLAEHPATESDNVDARADRAVCQGIILIQKGDYTAACEPLDAVADARNDFYPRYMRALAYLRAGQFEKAVSQYHKLVHSYDFDRIFAPIESTKVHYYAGVAYEKAGLRDDAMAEYTEFLYLMRDADPGIDTVDDARTRLERLNQGS